MVKSARISHTEHLNNGDKASYQNTITNSIHVANPDVDTIDLSDQALLPGFIRGSLNLGTIKHTTLEVLSEKQESRGIS